MRIAGRILNTNLESIYQVMIELYGRDQVWIRDNNDLVVHGSLLFLEVYFNMDSKHGGRNYLLEGRLGLELSDAIHLLSTLGTQLQRNAIVYSLELYDESAPSESPILVEHPRFMETI